MSLHLLLRESRVLSGRTPQLLVMPNPPHLRNKNCADLHNRKLRVYCEPKSTSFSGPSSISLWFPQFYYPWNDVPILRLPLLWGERSCNTSWFHTNAADIQRKREVHSQIFYIRIKKISISEYVDKSLIDLYYKLGHMFIPEPFPTTSGMPRIYWLRTAHPQIY